MPAGKNDNTTFETLLKRLNTAQRTAVVQTEGPVLVLAGPGTGKTHILASRIGYILAETDTPPSGILCLTFTDAGVIAMRRRLLEIIGPTAHKVPVFTFHSFCNKVIQEHLELFGKPELEPISDLQRVEIIRHILEELPIDHPLRRNKSDPFYYEKHLADLFSQMKSQDWSTGHVQQAISDYTDGLPFREDFKYKRKSGTAQKGDLMMHKIDHAKDKMQKLDAAAGLYDRYMQEMHRRQVYDFDDMILWVLRAFEKNEYLLRQYQEQYLYFLVDEYQDTNSAQNHILLHLIRYWESPNIFIVGDDDQSIYEFQGARLRNLIDFHDAYQQELLLVVLEENYRSTQQILDSARTVIEHNEKRVVNLLKEKGLTKYLQSKNPLLKKSTARPTLTTYANRLQEEADIVERIARLQESGCPLNEIAIITARHQQAANIVKLLGAKGIPYATNRRINILELPVISQLISLLEYVYAEFRQPYSAETTLFKLLYFHFFNISPADIARLSFYIRERKDLSWRHAIADETILLAAGILHPETFLKVSLCLESLIGDVVNQPLPQLVEHAINHSGWLRYLYELPDRSQQLEIAGTFMDFVQSETRRHPQTTLRDLLRTFEQMQDNQLRLSVQQQIVSAKGVQILTAHASKGLEFRYVFIPDGTRDSWEPSTKTNSQRFGLPETLTYSGEEDALEARRRLFYVAVTRAKEYLYLSCSEKDYNGKPLERACFLDEISVAGTVETITGEVPAELAAAARYHLLLHTEAPQIQPVETDQVAAILEGFTLNLTAMSRYLDCPLSFYFQHILHMPRVENEATVYGTAAHHALRRAFEKMLQDKQKVFPEVESFVRFFDQELERHKGQLLKDAFQRRQQQGRFYLPLYYEHHRDRWQQETQVELEIRHVEFRGVPLEGYLDRVDFLGNGHVRIVDYKTGVPDAKKTKGPSKNQPYGSNYWRQLLFYKILYEQYRPQQIAVAGEISFLDPDQKGEFITTTLPFTPEDVAIVADLITDTYRRIMRQEFYEGCGKPDCTWCNFVRYQTALAEDRNLAMEDLDDVLIY